MDAIEAPLEARGNLILKKLETCYVSLDVCFCFVFAWTFNNEIDLEGESANIPE